MVNVSLFSSIFYGYSMLAPYNRHSIEFLQLSTALPFSFKSSFNLYDLSPATLASSSPLSSFNSLMIMPPNSIPLMASSNIISPLLIVLLLFFSFCSSTHQVVPVLPHPPAVGHGVSIGRSMTKPPAASSATTGCSRSSSSALPISEFLTTVKSTMEEIGQVTSMVSKFANGFGDFRLTNAITDCVDLLDFSTDELSWTISASENLKAGKDNSTGNRKSDLNAWLSAALGNQETCIDGFEGTNSFVKPIISGALQQVNSLVTNVLGMACQVPSSLVPPGKPGRKLLRTNSFPEWMKAGDRRLLQVAASGVSVNVTVAADGSGNFTSVMDAVLAAPDQSLSRYVIYVKKGIYKENVDIKKKKWNLMIIGDGMGVTVISSNRNFIDGWTTFRSATFAVAGRGFIARDITFENTAGPEKHQAVALRSDSDLSAFYRCGIHGYQDTLYAHSLRQFYRECHITGTVDFIFGNGAVILQNCQILAKKGLPNQKNTITAQGRKDPNQNTGFSIQFCNITADSDLLPVVNSTYTYLGRPWKEYSRTVIMKSYISSIVRPEGWLEWQGNFALDTLYYGEYQNYGPGAGLSNRVKWPGFHPISDPAQANSFTVTEFLDGNLWLPSTGVKYTAGLGV